MPGTPSEEMEGLLRTGAYEAAFRIAADQSKIGETWAIGAMGAMLMCGLGVEQDLLEARELLEKAARQGDSVAARNLVTYYSVFVGDPSLADAFRVNAFPADEGARPGTEE